ncbi:adenylyl-sulfate kinase [Flexivirga caeni]|uniref:Adenylyl-sulfate kinase n=2 Tax=Flexivirga caeni TaxID=2294115 RepID=A0A3M9M3N7_9MICO|nr:adenylyl-sulfate kinase [Flexivirga caeni]
MPAELPWEIVDPEGVPIARAERAEFVDGEAVLTEQPHWLGAVSTRPFERLYADPATVRAATAADGSAVVLVDRMVAAAELNGFGARPITLLVLAGPSVEPAAATLSVIRSALAAATERVDTRVVAVPLSPASPPDMVRSVAAAYTDGVVERLPTTSAAPPPARGVVLFFTGLSGSGKSTVARAVRNAILERSDRPVTLLDGDVVRRNLSAGLGFTPRDRETNIRRIGWVAAEIAHHGGLAICSPIAPAGATRQEVRGRVAERGGSFLLVHVATPVEECERRDRKGLYARARRGEIPDFTGISAPYDVPGDADLAIDTTDCSLDAARDAVLELLAQRGVLALGSAPR